MNKYIKILIKNFINLDEELIEETEIETETETNYITWSNLYYIIGILSIIGISFYLYNYGWFSFNENINNISHLKELDEIGKTIYKLSTEVSKSSTVQGWDIIHKVLKDLNTNSINRIQIIDELENLKEMNIKFPKEFSTNHVCFEKSLIKLINFLKEIL